MPNIAKTPTGTTIKGTLEAIPGIAIIDGIRKTPDGKIEWDYFGETDVLWDAQETVMRNGSPVFIDENGDEWSADDLTIVEGDS